MNSHCNSFGRELSQSRAQLKMSQEELANKAGISASMLSKIERDETNPTILVASKLARALNTTVSALLGESTKEKNVDNIEKFIESLKMADEQLESIVARRKEFEPDFHVTFHRTYIIDKNCRLLFASILAARTFGLSQSDMIGKHWRELGLSAEIMEEFETNVRTVFITGKSRIAETRFHGSTGIGYIEYRLKPLFNDTGILEAVMATVRTITDKKINELELKNHITRLTSIIDTCPIGIVTVDRFGTIHIFNNAAQRLLAPFNPGNWVGKDLRSWVKWVGINYEDAPLVRALRGEEASEVLIPALGKTWVVSFAPIKDAIGVIAGGLLFFYCKDV